MLLLVWDQSPICLHWEVGLYDLYRSQPLGGNQNILGSPFQDVCGILVSSLQLFLRLAILLASYITLICITARLFLYFFCRAQESRLNPRSRRRCCECSALFALLGPYWGRASRAPQWTSKGLHISVLLHFRFQPKILYSMDEIVSGAELILQCFFLYHFNLCYIF